MTELDQALHALAAELDWPVTPEFALRLGPAPRRSRRPLLVAIAVVLLAVAVALAVPTARSSILRFFHLGSVTIERVGTLAGAEEQPLAAGLGPRVTAAEAEGVLGAPFRPEAHGQLYVRDGIVSTLLAAPAPTLLSEFGSAAIMKKFVAGSTRIESVEIAPGVEGIWLAGEAHAVFFFPQASPRLAGNVLVWASGDVTFRLEGRTLTKRSAVELARQILGTAGG